MREHFGVLIMRMAGISFAVLSSAALSGCGNSHVGTDPSTIETRHEPYLELRVEGKRVYVSIVNASNHFVRINGLMGVWGMDAEIVFKLSGSSRDRKYSSGGDVTIMPAGKIPVEIAPYSLYGAFYDVDTIAEIYGVKGDCFDTTATYENKRRDITVLDGPLVSNTIKICFD